MDTVVHPARTGYPTFQPLGRGDDLLIASLVAEKGGVPEAELKPYETGIWEVDHPTSLDC